MVVDTSFYRIALAQGRGENEFVKIAKYSFEIYFHPSDTTYDEYEIKYSDIYCYALMKQKFFMDKFRKQLRRLESIQIFSDTFRESVVFNGYI